MTGRWAALAAAFFLGLMSGGAADARTLIVNANGITLTPEGELVRFTTLLVGDDGRVESILPRGAKEPKLGAGDFRLDARGRTLLPGLVDAHGHVMNLGFQLRQLDLTGTSCLDEALERTADAARAVAGDGWLRGRGWNQMLWARPEFPTAADLDKAVPDRPAALERVDGHALWVNSAALKAAGITAKTKDPPGGRILRNARGEPTGVLVDAAMTLVDAVIPPPTPLERDKAMQAAFSHLLSVGVTSVHDMGVDPDAWNLYRSFGDTDRLALRVTAYASGMEAMDRIAPLGPTPWLYGGRLRLQGVKLYADGALGSRGAYLKAPYADEPGNRGLLIVEETKLKNQMSRVNFFGFQLAVHAIGDAANSLVLDALAELKPTYGTDFRNRIEHAQVLDVADIPRFASLGVIASVQPIHATSDRLMAEVRLGPSRLEGAYAWNSLLRARARLAFGSDFPVEPANPFLGMQAAVARDGWRTQESIPATQALAGFTIWAAWAGKQEGKVGTLMPGAYADFVLVDADPLAVPPSDIGRIKVLETWVAGKRMFDASRPASTAGNDRAVAPDHKP
ncbi:amidohydrolase [Thermaurantiacus sp.]